MPILIRWDTGHWMVQEDKLNWLNGRDNRGAFKKFKLKFVKFCTGRQDSHIHFHHRNTGRMDDWIPSISRVTLLSLLPVLLLLLILCLPPPLPPQLRAVKTILPESDPPISINDLLLHFCLLLPESAGSVRLWNSHLSFWLQVLIYFWQFTHKHDMPDPCQQQQQHPFHAPSLLFGRSRSPKNETAACDNWKSPRFHISITVSDVLSRINMTISNIHNK